MIGMGADVFRHLKQNAERLTDLLCAGVDRKLEEAIPE